MGDRSPHCPAGQAKSLRALTELGYEKLFGQLGVDLADQASR